MLKDENSVVTRALFQFNVDYDAVKNEFSMMLSDINPKDEDSPAPKTEFGYSDHENEDDELFENKPKKSSTPANTKSSTPVLDNFGRDLTKMAADGRLDPIVGREKEIERVSQILSRRKKNKPILIG